MGFLDKLKGKATHAVDQHGDKIGDGVEKAVDFVDAKTGGKLGDKGDVVVDKAKDALDGLDGKNDDIRDSEPTGPGGFPEPGTEPGTDPGINPGTEPGTTVPGEPGETIPGEPTTQPGTTDPSVDPGAQPTIEPDTTDPAVDPGAEPTPGTEPGSRPL